MKTPGRSLFSFALVFALPLLLASCGGDGDDGSKDGAVVSDGQTGVDVRTIDRFEASAEIVMGRGPKPADNVRAFDARAVIDNLRPRIVYPEAKDR